MNVDAMIERLLGREGGYVHHSHDRGGETIWGITRAVALEEGYGGPMRDMPRATAVRIYRQRYWIAPRFDQLALLSAPVAEELFDTGVNMGPAVAVQMLQRCLNALNRQQMDYADLKADGHIGPATLGALQAFLRIRGREGEQVLLKALNGLQCERYIDLAERRPANESFVYGWIKERVA